MERFVINSVNDMFRWKLPKEDLVDGESRIFQKSVEDYFRASTDILLWGPNTDVLYSFTLIYYLGISLYKEDVFNQLYQDEKNKQPKNKLCRYSTKFLYKCSKDERFESFNSNQDVVGFVNNYFSLGNVIPIWPGGNEARGKMGILDLPEIFFNTYPEWTKELLRQNPNARMDSVINNSLFLVSRKEAPGFHIKGYKDTFSSFEEFKRCVKDRTNFDLGTGFYFDYLRHRINVIKKREEELQNIVAKTYK